MSRPKKHMRPTGSSPPVMDAEKMDIVLQVPDDGPINGLMRWRPETWELEFWVNDELEYMTATALRKWLMGGDS